MVEFVIDGKKVKAERGESLLKVALAHGIDIPYLCYHPAVTPYGACRLCLVEVTAESHGRKRTKLTTSCNYPVLEGIEVVTRSERIIQNRKGVIELLQARAPKSKRIQQLAADYGVVFSVNEWLFDLMGSEPLKLYVNAWDNDDPFAGVDMKIENKNSRVRS